MNLRWHLAHARGYLELGMLKQAQAELDRIGPPENELPVVRALQVALLHEKQDWRRLRKVAGALARQQPEESAWWVSFAFATRRAVSIAAARKILLEAEQHHPSEATIQFNLGCYACQLGELSEARDRVARAIAIDEAFRKHAETDPDLEALRTARDGA